MTDSPQIQELQVFREQLQGMLGVLDQREKEAREQAARNHAGRSAGVASHAQPSREARSIPDERTEKLMEEISAAYKQLASTRRKLARAESARAAAETRIRVQHRRALEAAKNERTAALYLDSLLDTDEYKKLMAAKEDAELDHSDARAEVDRLQLTVRLLRASNPSAGEAGDDGRG